MARIQRDGHELESFELHADLDDLDRRSKLRLLWAVLDHQTEVVRSHTEKLRLAGTIVISLVIILMIAATSLSGDTGLLLIIKELVAAVK